MVKKIIRLFKTRANKILDEIETAEDIVSGSIADASDAELKLKQNLLDILTSREKMMSMKKTLDKEDYEDSISVHNEAISELTDRCKEIILVRADLEKNKDILSSKFKCYKAMESVNESINGMGSKFSFSSDIKSVNESISRAKAKVDDIKNKVKAHRILRAELGKE